MARVALSHASLSNPGPFEMPPLFATFAVKEESHPFQELTGSRSDLRVLLTGIGQRNAEKTIRKALAGSPPNLVLTCGFAGGLNPELAAGAVIFSADEDFSLSPVQSSRHGD